MSDAGAAARWRSLAPHALSVLRIFAAFFLIPFGTTKLFALPGAIMPDGSVVPVASLPGIAGVLEVCGGLLLLVGLFTRPVAFLLSGSMAAAYFLEHAPRGFWPVLNGGTIPALFSFVFLYLSAAGGGPWSVDAFRRGSR